MKIRNDDVRGLERIYICHDDLVRTEAAGQGGLCVETVVCLTDEVLNVFLSGMRVADVHQPPAIGHKHVEHAVLV